MTRAICIFIKICIGKEINPKKHVKLPLNYNKNSLPEFQRCFLCLLCDFLTDLERFSVVKVPTVSSLYISFQGRALELERRPDPLKENGHKFLPKALIASKLLMALER